MSGSDEHVRPVMRGPTFMSGYPFEQRYHNLGSLRTPYEGKRGLLGDYGPLHRADPQFVYPLDVERRGTYILGDCSPRYGQPRYSAYALAVETQYPEQPSFFHYYGVKL